MNKIIIEQQQPNKVTRNYEFNKLLIENQQTHKIIRSKDKVIVRQQDTKTQTSILVKNTNLVVKQQDTKSIPLIIHN